MSRGKLKQKLMPRASCGFLDILSLAMWQQLQNIPTQALKFVERCCSLLKNTMRGASSEPPRPCAASVLGPVGLAMLWQLQEIRTKALTLFERYCTWLKHNHARLEFCTPKAMRGLCPGHTWPRSVVAVTGNPHKSPNVRLPRTTRAGPVAKSDTFLSRSRVPRPSGAGLAYKLRIYY